MAWLCLEAMLSLHRFDFPHCYCRAHRQEDWRGLICYETDMWVEHSLIQPAKRHTKFRMVSGPERLLVSNLLYADRLQQLLNDFPDELYPIEAKCTKAGRSGAKETDKLLDILGDDEEDNASRDIMLGRPTTVIPAEHGEVAALLTILIEEFPDKFLPYWHPDLVREFELNWFYRCCLRKYEIVHSDGYRKATKTLSVFCKARFTEGDVEKTYVAKIFKFLKLELPGSGRILRLALCKLYLAEVIDDYRGKCLSVSGGRMKHPMYSGAMYPIPLELLDHKLVYCNLTRAKDNRETPEWLFIPYSNVASAVDPGLE